VKRPTRREVLTTAKLRKLVMWQTFGLKQTRLYITILFAFSLFCCSTYVNSSDSNSSFSHATNHGWDCPKSNSLLRTYKLHFTEWNAFISKAVQTQNIDIDAAFALVHKELKKFGVHMNGIMIGACDGTRDEYISFVRRNTDTSVLFVEPVPHNFADLVDSFPEDKVGRFGFVQAASDATCNEEGATRTLSYINKSFEDKKPESGHWIRRQIGSMHPNTAQFLKARFSTEGYLAESSVACLSPRLLTERFLEMQAKLNANLRRCHREGTRQRILSAKVQKRLSDFHVLKMDTEGLDHNIVTGFLDQVMCSTCRDEIARKAPQGIPGSHLVFNYSDLKPLMIVYEYKLINDYPAMEPGGKTGAELLDELEKRLISNGYFLLKFAGDIIAVRKFMDTV